MCNKATIKSKLITPNFAAIKQSHLLLLSLLLSLTNIAVAAPKEYFPAHLCPQPLSIPARPTVDSILKLDDIHLTADDVDLVEDGVSVMTGNAEITQNQQQVRADLIKYYSQEDSADLKGNVHYWDETLFLLSDDAFITFDNGVGQFTNAHYNLIDKHGWGIADKMTVDLGTRTDLQEANYTTCNPGEEFWTITAKDVTLDYEQDQGSGWHVVTKIKNIPVFYSPYLSFPLSDARKTGFLSPSYGSTNRHGVELLIPYYWNIRPNMDTTITSRLLADSGLMLMGEYRFLHDSGNGLINAEFLPNDRKRDDKTRYLLNLKLTQTFGKGRFSLNYNKVSDKFYFEEFGNNLSISSTRFLEQTAHFNYNESNWNISATIQNYQTVDRTININSRPYKKLPQIQFNYNVPRQTNAFNYGLTSEAVYFKRDDNDISNNINGLRVHFDPYISYRATNRATFIEPKLRLRYTQYSLDTDDANQDNSPSRIVPLFSLDSGVFLERSITLFDETLLQTLEPRLYYLYVPKIDQNDLPIFDTGQHTFSFNSLFREDRFNNPDRIGDANQVTLAVTSNHISHRIRRNLGYIRLGQIFYLNDREELSPFVAQVGLFPLKHLRILNELQWNWNGEGAQRLNSVITYNPEAGKVLNLAYRDHGDIEQSAISFRWPIINNLSAVGHWTYDLPEQRSLEIFAGIEYDSCCWSARAVARRFLTNSDLEYETGFFLQLELKGLAGIGRKTGRFLEQKIPGYQREF